MDEQIVKSKDFDYKKYSFVFFFFLIMLFFKKKIQKYQIKLDF